MTFETFVVSAASEAAFAAARAVAEERPDAPNPLFLVGPTGAGKSHLLMAIEAELLRRRPGVAGLRVSARTVADTYIAAIRSERIETFRRALVELDALLIDDFRLDPKVTEAIVTLVDDCSRHGVRVVIAADVLHCRIPDSAHIVQLGYPDVRVRLEIARLEAAKRRLVVPDAALRSLAQRGSGNPREVQSAVARLAAEAALAPRKAS